MADAHVNFSQPDPDVAPHERRPILQAAGGPGGTGSSKHASKYAMAGMEETSFDVDSRDKGPQRSSAAAPAGFGHPRGLAEDPVRPGCYSNFGKGGVRHYRKRGAGAHGGPVDNQLQTTSGGLAPTAGPIRYGHQTTGLGSISPEGITRRRAPYLNQRKENFVGLRFVGTDDSSRDGGHADGKYAPGHKHTTPADAPWANHFDDAKYSWTNHNDVFGPGGERRHVALIPGELTAITGSKDPMDTSHLFRNPESPDGESTRGKFHTEKQHKALGEYSNQLSPRDRSKPPAWGWNPKLGRNEEIEQIPDVIGTHQNHTAGKLHRKKHTVPDFDEREFRGASRYGTGTFTPTTLRLRDCPYSSLRRDGHYLGPLPPPCSARVLSRLFT